MFRAGFVHGLGQMAWPEHPLVLHALPHVVALQVARCGGAQQEGAVAVRQLFARQALVGRPVVVHEALPHHCGDGEGCVRIGGAPEGDLRVDGRIPLGRGLVRVLLHNRVVGLRAEGVADELGQRRLPRVLLVLVRVVVAVLHDHARQVVLKVGVVQHAPLLDLVGVSLVVVRGLLLPPMTFPPPVVLVLGGLQERHRADASPEVATHRVPLVLPLVVHSAVAEGLHVLGDSASDLEFTYEEQRERAQYAEDVKAFGYGGMDNEGKDERDSVSRDFGGGIGPVTLLKAAKDEYDWRREGHWWEQEPSDNDEAYAYQVEERGVLDDTNFEDHLPGMVVQDRYYNSGRRCR